MEFRDDSDGDDQRRRAGDGSGGRNLDDQGDLGNDFGSTVLTVTAATLVSIAVTPANPSIAKGTTQQFTATGTYSDSSTANITSSVTWSSGTADDGDDQRRRAGDGSSGGNLDDQGDLGNDLGLDRADGDAGNAGVDRGDARESIDREGDDAAVHGDGNVLG